MAAKSYEIKYILSEECLDIYITGNLAIHTLDCYTS